MKKVHARKDRFFAQNTETPINDDRAPMEMDLLSRVLQLVRLSGNRIHIRDLHEHSALRLKPDLGYFHYIEKGSAWVWYGDRDPIAMSEGDLILLPHSKGHRISVRAQLPATIRDLDDETLSETGRNKNSQGDESATRLNIGSFCVDPGAVASITGRLPEIINVRKNDGDASQWLSLLVHFIMVEAHDPKPGATLMISRLIDVLVIRVLRFWSQHGQEDGKWLAVLQDERIGRALSAFYGDPASAWSVAALARIAGMSKSAFAERFARLIGTPPQKYLTHWRLQLAADLLRGGNLKVGEVAYRVGFASEAAFSRAFKLSMGITPHQAKSGQ